MPRPELYTWHTYEAAASLFGPLAAADRLCDGQWLVFPEAALCLARLGEAPHASHFEDAAQFCWVTEHAYAVSDRPFAEFVPAQVVGSAARARAIHLFARPPDARDYIYLGALEPSHVQQTFRDGRPSLARFELRPALPSATWRQIGRTPAELDAARLDRALDRLRGPTGVKDRLDVLREIVTCWHGPIAPADGMSDAELGAIPLPAPLRWWYRWAGHRSEIMSGQNFLLEPHAKPRGLTVEKGRLLFHTENQDVYEWATLPDGDDPQVFGRWAGDDEWVREDVTLSEHLILACLFEAAIGADYKASAAWLADATVAAISEVVPPIAVAPWRWLDTRFHAAAGAVVFVTPNGKVDGKAGSSLWIGAKSEAPLQFLKPYLDDGYWEHVAI